ncbi:MAG TPA: MarR family transcriptional regulator [Thermoanaerobaculia bacterium]|jgi:DNA-binding MarR family transcriptional regulator|nr:MarR family transcriptional regulator [Thermoanaerobaculia bacterium]
MTSRQSQIQRELRQTRPFRSPAHEAVVSLLRTADVVRRRLGAVVEPHGITIQQYNVLRILRGAGEAGLPTLEIAERMIERTPGITRLLDRLERKEQVVRWRPAADRRQVLCRLTPAGAALLAALDGPLQATQEALLASLEPAAQERLVTFFDLIRSTPEPSPAPSDPSAPKGPEPGRTNP